MTTREVQTVIGRTREHTSRLMKKLFEEKLVDRDVSTKPFRYAITVEGRKLLSKHSASKSHSHLDLANNVNPLNDLIEK
jgi:CTP-dependent riboflavin kinase